MEVKIHVRNLSRATTRDDLNTLFTRAGEVTVVDLIVDRNSGESKGFAFITMSAQSEADKAVSMFNNYLLAERPLKVDLTRPRDQRGFRAGR